MDSSAKPQPIQRPAYAQASAGKRLVLIRHAKAVEEDVGGDHARGLGARGKEEAAGLASWLTAQGITPDLVLCSTAARTRETLAALGSQLPTVLSDKLYLASPAELLGQIRQVDDQVNTLMVIAHNPGLQALAIQLVTEDTGTHGAGMLLLKFPTSGCVVMNLLAPRWDTLKGACTTLIAANFMN